MNKKLMTIRIPEELRKKLKIQAIEEGRSIQEIILELVKGYLDNAEEEKML